MAIDQWMSRSRQDVVGPEFLLPNNLCPLKASYLLHHQPVSFPTSSLLFVTTMSTRFCVQGCRLAVPWTLMPGGKNRSNKSAVTKTTTAIMASDPADEVVERFVTHPMTTKEISSIGRSLDNEDDKDRHVDEKGKRHSIFVTFPMTTKKVSLTSRSLESVDDADCYLDGGDERHSVRFSDETEEFVYNGAKSVAAKYRRRRRMLRQPAAASVSDDEGCFSMQIEAVGETLEAMMTSMETALRQMSRRE
jgi:hypothetical protein